MSNFEETTDTPTAVITVSDQPITPQEIIQEINELPPEVRAMLPTLPPNLDRLKDILSLCRCHDGSGERKFIDTILGKYRIAEYLDETGKDAAAYVITTDQYKSTVLWSCHIDTVHKASSPTRQIVEYDPGTEMMYKRDNEPLGADDGAGVWLLLEMIDAGIPGTYIFHRGEEKGGIGSKIMAKCYPDMLKKYTHAIAFDRRDTVSVITKQRGSRCCSDAFANHLAGMVCGNDEAYLLKPDPTGTFTDTANYTDLIGECTNVSIGYYNEHTGSEVLDLAYLFWLRGKMITIDVPKLVSINERKPGEKEPFAYGGYGGRVFGDFDDELWGYPHYGSAKAFDRFGSQFNPPPPPAKKKKGKVVPITTNSGASSYHSMPSGGHFRKVKTAEDVLNMKAFEVKNWVATAGAWEIADLLISLALQVVFGKEKK